MESRRMLGLSYSSMLIVLWRKSCAGVPSGSPPEQVLVRWGRKFGISFLGNFYIWTVLGFETVPQCPAWPRMSEDLDLCRRAKYSGPLSPAVKWMDEYYLRRYKYLRTDKLHTRWDNVLYAYYLQLRSSRHQRHQFSAVGSSACPSKCEDVPQWSRMNL